MDARLDRAAFGEHLALALQGQLEAAVVVELDEAGVAQVRDIVDRVGRDPAEAEDAGVEQQVELGAGGVVAHEAKADNGGHRKRQASYLDTFEISYFSCRAPDRRARPQNRPVKTSTPERFEAIGPRGEACIIVRFEVALSNGTTQMSHALASGERLKPTDDPAAFETLDGKRVFRFRQPDAGLGLGAGLPLGGGPKSFGLPR